MGAAEIEDVVAAWVRQGVSLEMVLRYAVLREHHSAVHAITAALLDGRATATMARRCGVEIASHYWVLALAVADHPESPRAGCVPTARRPGAGSNRCAPNCSAGPAAPRCRC